MRDEALLIAAERWHRRNWLRLAGEGITMALRPRTTNLSKNSVSVEFATASQVVSAVFWDSGESEVIAANKHDLTAPTVENPVVETVEDVFAVLEFVYGELARAT